MNKRFELVDFLKYGDSFSGRDTGVEYSQSINLLYILEQGYNVEIVIDNRYIKAINDSFIKGLFNDVFKKYGKTEVVKRVNIISDEYFVKLFEKNWTILEAIHEHDKRAKS